MNTDKMRADAEERAIVGAALMWGGRVMDVVDLDPADIFDPRLKAIFSAMRRLSLDGKPPGDPVLLEAEIGPTFSGIGQSYLADLARQGGYADAAPHYADAIKQASLTRELHAKVRAVLDSDLAGDELQAALAEAILSITPARRDNAKPMADLVVSAVKSTNALIQAAMDGKPAVRGVPTGFPGLDRVTGGIQRGKITILAARPSMGKSALARSIAANANDLGFGAHVISAEDDGEAYAIRQLSDVSGLDLAVIRAGDIRTSGDINKFLSAGNDIRKRKNWIVDDSTGISSADVALRVRRHLRDNSTSLVVVDYLQLVREASAKPGDRKAAVDLALSGLADLARKENIGMLVLSQLNRECESRDNKRPQLSDLRESGEIEQVADVVLMLHRPGHYFENVDGTIADLIVAKNKSGLRCVVPLDWRASTATYTQGERGDRRP